MGNVATRAVFGETLARLGEKHEEIVVLDADLSESTKSSLFAKKFPERFFEMGIAEANMIGTGAGLALNGKVVFLCSFGCFVTGRYDQIRMSIAANGANVRIVGTHAGLAIGEDGYSQMGLEDINVMRGVPTMKILQPVDKIETAQAVEYLVKHVGPVYLRLTRQAVPDLNPEDYRFEFGKGVTLKEGSDVAIIASGAVVGESMNAAKEMEEKKGIKARVINIHTIKPLDTELVAKAARDCGIVVTVEDHSIIGGLGTSVCEAVSEIAPCKVMRIGIADFGESGPPRALYEKYGLSAGQIASRIMALMNGKPKGRNAK